jgi:hypothetical protein
MPTTPLAALFLAVRMPEIVNSKGSSASAIRTTTNAHQIKPIRVNAQTISKALLTDVIVNLFKDALHLKFVSERNFNIPPFGNSGFPNHEPVLDNKTLECVVKYFFLLVFLCPTFVNGQEPPSTTQPPKNLIQTWREWKSRFDKIGGTRVTTFSNVPVRDRVGLIDGIPFERRTDIQRDRRHSISTNLMRDRSQRIFFSNPDYKAEISKDENSIWQLDRLIIRHLENEGDPSSSIESTFYCTSFLFAWIGAEELERMTPKISKTKDGTWLFDYQLQHNARYERVSLFASPKHDWLPSKIVISYLPPNNFTSTIYFNSFQKHKDEWVWGSVVNKFSDDKTATVYDFDIDSVPSTPNKSSCYLSYYDLPEPKIPRSMRPIWLAVSIGSGVGLLTFFFYRKRGTK